LPVTKRLVVRPLAAQDIDEAAGWYERQAPGLGEEFLAAVDRRLAEIQTAPDRFPRISPRLRRALLRRFPYAIFFTIVGDMISVVACMHGRRHPARWLRRG
jgi:plasmid stabilization system protein ParE